MRHASVHFRFPPNPRAAHARGDWRTIRTLLPYLWEYKGRVIAALVVPGRGQGRQRRRAAAAEGDRRQPRPRARRCSRCRSRCSSPTACCACRRRCSPSCASSCSPRSRSARCARSRSKVFRHLHALSLRFHLARQTGGLTRDVERGQRGISTLISFTLFSILPTLVEIALVSAILIARYDWTFIAITLARSSLYIAFTVLDHRVAHALPPHDERARLEGEHARDRQPAQLRDGQVLRQRGVRGAPLRREPAALGEGGGEEPDVAVGCSTSGRARSSRSR